MAGLLSPCGKTTEKQMEHKPRKRIEERGPQSANSMAGRETLHGNAPDLINLLPMAPYGARAPDGVITWFNSRAAELWGRVPVVGDTDERFCGAYKLYHSDGCPYQKRRSD